MSGKTFYQIEGQHFQQVPKFPHKHTHTPTTCLSVMGLFRPLEIYIIVSADVFTHKFLPLELSVILFCRTTSCKATHKSLQDLCKHASPSLTMALVLHCFTCQSQDVNFSWRWIQNELTQIVLTVQYRMRLKRKIKNYKFKKSAQTAQEEGNDVQSVFQNSSVRQALSAAISSMIYVSFLSIL